MRYIILADGTTIDNCRDDTTFNDIYVVRDSYEDAAAVRNIFTKENSTVIRIYDNEDHEIGHSADLVLNDGCDIFENYDKTGFICHIRTRYKDILDTILEQISELQDVVLELVER